MFRARDLQQIIQPVRLELHSPDWDIQHVSIDSRQIVFGVESLFIAIQGNRTDGHRFIADAWRRGVRNFIISDEAHGANLDTSNVFVVKDTVRALQAMAVHHRSQFDIPFIGITGSNGKTWVKEWLSQLLMPDCIVVKSPRSYNSQIGVPLSILQVRPHHQIAIIEAGISMTGEMEHIEKMIKPDIGILTNIGDAHASGFISQQEKLEEKCKLFQNAKAVIFPVDQSLIADNVARLCPQSELISWGQSDNAVLEVIPSIHRHRIVYRYQKRESTLEVQSFDSASRFNMLSCVTALQYLGVSMVETARRAALLKPITMRLEMHALGGNCLLINDTYSLDLASLRIGLETLNQHSAGRKKALIISDVAAQHTADYKEISRLIKAHKVDVLFTIGSAVKQLEGLGKEVEFQHFESLVEFIAKHPWQTRVNTAYLLKGARSFALENIVQYMRLRSHSAVLEIDFNAMLTNLQQFASRLSPHTEIIGMVKAAAYGSGSVEVGKFLEYNNVDRLCVAYVDEGVELRQAGVTLPIIVLNPDPSELVHIVDFRLEPEVYSIRMLQDVIALVHGTGHEVKIHLKFDTGMHRLGFGKSELDDLIPLLAKEPRVVVGSVFTHLAAADSLDHDPFTKRQVVQFEQMAERLKAALGIDPMRHVLNSHGAMRFPQYQFDAVRLGIGLYGLGMAGTKGLVPVHKFKAVVSQVRTIGIGETVGYGRAFTAARETDVATINVGYADGVPRSASNCSYKMQVHGQDVPLIGRVCMDMCMLDVTDVEGVSPGDEVEVFGPNVSVEGLAECCGTIAYEILTGISQRIPRIFKFD